MLSSLAATKLIYTVLFLKRKKKIHCLKEDKLGSGAKQKLLQIPRYECDAAFTNLGALPAVCQ
jgi:hypothetical protein